MLIWPSNWANKKIEGFMGIETLTSQCYWRGGHCTVWVQFEDWGFKDIEPMLLDGNGETVRLGTLWVHFERCSVGYADTLDAAQQEGLTTQTHT